MTVRLADATDTDPDPGTGNGERERIGDHSSLDADEDHCPPAPRRMNSSDRRPRSCSGPSHNPRTVSRSAAPSAAGSAHAPGLPAPAPDVRPGGRAAASASRAFPCDHGSPGRGCDPQASAGRSGTQTGPRPARANSSAADVKAVNRLPYTIGPRRSPAETDRSDTTGSSPRPRGAMGSIAPRTRTESQRSASRTILMRTDLLLGSYVRARPRAPLASGSGPAVDEARRGYRARIGLLLGDQV
jgi:hypothetical protein